MKKKIPIVAVVVIVSCIALFCIKIFPRETKVITFSQEEIISAYITNGNNGEISQLTKSEIGLLFNDMKNVLIKNGKEVDSTGWQYSITFSLDKKDYSVVLHSETLWDIDGKEYTVSAQVGEKVLKDMESIEK